MNPLSRHAEDGVLRKSLSISVNSAALPASRLRISLHFWLVFWLILPAASLLGCRSVDHFQADRVGTEILSAKPIAVRAAPTVVSRKDAAHRAHSARKAAQRSENNDLDECVDRYYEAAVFSYVALGDPANSPGQTKHAVNAYNENLADCLRTATRFGRLDPRSQLLVNGPMGTIVVPVTHKGFVWAPGDFSRLLDPDCARKNPSQKVSHIWPGVGAPQVGVRRNPHLTAADQFLPDRSFIPVTAVLRPNVGAWLDGAPDASGTDSLELIDPMRVRCVDLAGRKVALAGNLDASVSMAEAALDSRRFALTGFINPSSQLDKTGIGFVEPYQPGKVVVVFIHGLLDNPYVFTDLVNNLRARPGFLDKFQIATARYPTGNTFLRTAAMIRQKLREAEATFDPSHSDPGFQNMVLVGYSMGGLVAKLQITNSGDDVWQLASKRPLDQMVTPEASRELLRKIFYFEPQPFVRRVVFIATPHEGSGLATNVVGRIATRLVNRPPDTVELMAQLQRDNPGVLKEYAIKLPTSVDLLARNGELLQTLDRIQINPLTSYHVIAGTGYLPLEIAHGDGVVPLSSAHVDGSTSELLVPAFHTDIYRKPETIEEVHRILYQHLGELSTPTRGEPAQGN